MTIDFSNVSIEATYLAGKFKAMSDKTKSELPGLFSGLYKIKKLSLEGFILLDEHIKIRGIIRGLFDVPYIEEINIQGMTDLSSLGSMFFNSSINSVLKRVDLSEFNMSKVTNIGYMFHGQKKLESVNFGDISSVVLASHVFYNCESLVSIDFGDNQVEHIKDLYNAFGNCSSIKYLNLRQFNVKHTPYFDSIFSGCSGLETIDISNFRVGPGVRKMFEGCSSLETVIAPNDPESRAYITHYLNRYGIEAEIK